MALRPTLPPHNERNWHPRDKHLTFDPKCHTYAWFCNGPDDHGIPLRGVSTILDAQLGEFNREACVQFWMRSRPEASAAQLMLELEEKCERTRTDGHAVHAAIDKWLTMTSGFVSSHQVARVACEDGPLDQPLTPDQRVMFNQWYSWFRKTHVPEHTHRTEWAVADEIARIAGTMDCLMRTLTGYILYDWKCKKTIGDEAKQRAALQLSLYRHMLRTRYTGFADVEIKLALVQLHPSRVRGARVIPLEPVDVTAALLGAAPPHPADCFDD